MSKTKIYDKDPDMEAQEKRERATKITFAQIQEILQRNVNKNITKTYTQYTRDLLDTYAQSPLSNIDNIREVSRFLTRVSMVYKHMISYFSTMPLYTYNITPISDYTKDIDVDKTLKNYQKVLKILHSFNMQKECNNIVSNTIRDGMYVGFMYSSDDKGMFLMPLDVKYCRIYGKTQSGEWIVYFDASFFTGDNLAYVEGLNGDTTGCWDQVFIDGYQAYQTDRTNLRWFRLTPERTFCMIASTDDEFNVPLPYFLPIFKSLLQLLDTEALMASKTELQNYKLILNKIPLISNSNDLDDFAVSIDLINRFQDILEEIVPDQVGIGTTPCDTEVISFDKSTSAVDTDELAKAMNNLFANGGINKLIVSSGDSSNANGIKYSICNDLGKVAVYLRRIESWLNFYIKNNIADGFYLEIFDQTQYNKEDYINQKKESLSFGGSKLDYFCSLGNTPYVAYNKLRFEVEVLNIQKYMIPPQTSYTMTSTDNKGGAPTKPDDEISEEGQATRDSGKNEDKGNL